MDNELNGNNNQSNTMAIAGMILGILSIVFCWIPLLGLVLAIIGLILGVKGLNNAKQMEGKGKGFGIAGISCGSVGIVLSIIYTVFWLFFALIINETVNAYNTYTNRNYIYDYNYNNLFNSSYNYNYKSDVNSILNSYIY